MFVLSRMMEDPDLRQREMAVTVRIQPAYVLLNSLKEMRKLSNLAVFIVEGAKIQILATCATSNRDAYVTLETLSGFTSSDLSPGNRYALHVDLDTWLPRLSNPILQQPAAPLCFLKPQGSTNLNCVIGNNQQAIDLGDARFVPAQSVHMNGFHYQVQVTMRTQCFREVIPAFGYKYDHVQLVITDASIHWVTPSGAISHAAGDCSIQGIEPGIILQVSLRWNSPLFNVIYSASNCYDCVVFCVFSDPKGLEWHHFRFLLGDRFTSFCYVDRTQTVSKMVEKAKQ